MTYIETSRAIELSGVSAIYIGDTALTLQNLAEDRERWKSQHLHVGIYRDLDRSDEEILRRLLCGLVPYEIKADGDVTLDAHIGRYQYYIDGDPNYERYSLVLAPRAGAIKEITFKPDCSLAVNRARFTPEVLDADLGNGSLHLQIFFQPQDELPELTPPEGFQADVRLPHA